MQAIKDIYRIGYGPSSSHTIAPKRAMDFFVSQYGLLDEYIVDLYGSLALTGKGHHTDDIIKKSVLDKKITINFNYDNLENKMIIKGFKNHHLVDEWEVLSLGGGSIRIDKYDSGDEKEIYPHHNFNDIKKYLQDHNLDLLTYILSFEPDLFEHLDMALKMMIEEIDRGLNSEGLLNKELNYYRVAKGLLKEAKDDDSRLIAYAYAAGEENAAGHMVCTAPTLGSCGIVASLMYYLYQKGTARKSLLEALAVGGLFGNLIKENASISGALGGCQAEVGTACSMAAAMISYLNKAALDEIEYAAEVGIEHHLGLTCDPVLGYVIVPCIERNGVAVLRAFDAAKIAHNLLKVKKNLIDFDTVVASMKDTADKIPNELKETSLGGLALRYRHGKC